MALRLLFTLCLFILASPAMAEEQNPLPSCGEATDFELSEEATGGLCDIYTRQLDYREKRLELKESIEKRRIDYAKPRQQAYEAYRENLQAMYEDMDETDEDDGETKGEGKSETEEAEQQNLEDDDASNALDNKTGSAGGLIELTIQKQAIKAVP